METLLMNPADSQAFVFSHLTVLQIFHDEYVVGHPLLEQFSLVSFTTFEKTDRPTCSSASDQVSAESILHTSSQLLRGY